MIIYSCRTKKIPTTPDFIHNISNEYKMFLYNSDLMSNCGCIEKQDLVTKDVYYTYTTLVSFNNSLDKGDDSAFDLLKDYLENHPEIKESLDRKCITYYDKMSLWYRRYTSYPTPELFKSICKEVQELMRYLKKQELVSESSCNLKRNYYDE